MRTNEKTIITCSKCFLVPYKKYHVGRYHEWMECEELRFLTASERLTLSEEYDMQTSWHLDDNKCTFIILEKTDDARPQTETEEVASMLGDVNVFLNTDNESNDVYAELEIMIAETSARGQGIGKQAVLAMMLYCFHVLNISSFVTKIGYDNKPSITMFEKLGFQEESRSDAFREVTLQLKITDDLTQRYTSLLGTFNIGNDYHTWSEGCEGKVQTS